MNHPWKWSRVQIPVGASFAAPDGDWRGVGVFCDVFESNEVRRGMDEHIRTTPSLLPSGLAASKCLPGVSACSHVVVRWTTYILVRTPSLDTSGELPPSSSELGLSAFMWMSSTSAEPSILLPQRRALMDWQDINLLRRGQESINDRPLLPLPPG